MNAYHTDCMLHLQLDILYHYCIKPVLSAVAWHMILHHPIPQSSEAVRPLQLGNEQKDAKEPVTTSPKAQAIKTRKPHAPTCLSSLQPLKLLGAHAVRYSPLVAHKTQTIYQGAAAGPRVRKGLLRQDFGDWGFDGDVSRASSDFSNTAWF